MSVVEIKPAFSKAKTDTPEWVGRVHLNWAGVSVGNRLYSQKVAEKIREDFGTTPEVLYEAMKAGLPEGCFPKIIFKRESRRNKKYVLELQGYDKDGKLLIKDSRDFYLDDRAYATQGNIRIKKQHNYGKGLGRQFMFNQCRLLKEIGVGELRAYISSSNGAYTWSRFGFKIDPKSYWDDAFNEVEKRLAILARHMGDGVVAPFFERLQKVSRTDPYLFYTISQWDEAVDDYLGDKKVACIRENDILTESEDYLLNKSMTLGQYLLCSQSIHAVFDLNDPDQLALAERYCGRSFETGEPLPPKSSVQIMGASPGAFS